MKFADPLYAAYHAVYEALGEFGVKKPDKIDGTLLQVLGTDWGRSTLDPDIWVHLLQDRIRRTLQIPRAVVIIDDVRFPNEAECWDPNESCLVRLVAPESVRRLRAEKWRTNTAHPSETALELYTDWDVVFDTTEFNRDITGEIFKWLTSHD